MQSKTPVAVRACLVLPAMVPTDFHPTAPRTAAPRRQARHAPAGGARRAGSFLWRTCNAQQLSGGVPAWGLWLDREPGAVPRPGRAGCRARIGATGLVPLPAL